MKEEDSIYISGRVIEKGYQPLIGVTVGVKGTKNIVCSDYDGFYKLNITEELKSNNEVTLVYSYIGEGRLERTIKADSIKKNNTIDVALTINPKLTTFCITDSYDKPHPKPQPWYKRTWNKIKNIFRKKK